MILLDCNANRFTIRDKKSLFKLPNIPDKIYCSSYWFIDHILKLFKYPKFHALGRKVEKQEIFGIYLTVSGFLLIFTYMARNHDDIARYNK